MNAKIFALIDCNNFYVSCERVFNASIQHTPVIVMSNNDGCVIARSNEVKKLGIKMGQPIFQIRHLITQHHIQLFSSNFSLYADMSARVMEVLRAFAPTVEVYSIDEAFLDLTSLDDSDDLTCYGRQIQQRVLQATGIPVSVGIASTKTLAKIAAHWVKHHPEYTGVLDLSHATEQDMDALLSHVPVEEIWGIGPQYGLYLKSKAIMTAKDLKDCDEKRVRKRLTIVGERTILELRGISCLPVDAFTKAKKGIMSSKSFGRPINRLEELTEAVATYTARCAEKLRSQDSLTSQLTVYLRTSLFNTSVPHYANSFSLSIPYPTSSTCELIKHALFALHLIYKEGYQYQKAGVSFSHIVPDDTLQPDLFHDFSLEQHYKHARVMAIVDAINRTYGRDTLFFAVQGISRPWNMKQEQLSPRFTTRWSDILTVQ